MVKTPDELRRQAYGGDVVAIKTTEVIRYDNRKNLETLPFVRGKVKVIGDQEIEVVVDEANTAVPELVEALKGEKITVETIEEVSPPFDDVFVRLIEKEADNGKTL